MFLTQIHIYLIAEGVFDRSLILLFLCFLASDEIFYRYTTLSAPKTTNNLAAFTDENRKLIFQNHNILVRRETELLFSQV